MESEPLEYFADNSLLKAQAASRENELKKTFELPEWLKDSESPFKWLMSLRLRLLYTTNLRVKVLDYFNQGPDYGFEKCTLLLALLVLELLDYDDDDSEGEDSSTEVSRDGNTEQNYEGSSSTEENSCELETLYERCKEAVDEMAAREGDIMYTRIGPALQHVLQATKAYLLYFKQRFAESKEIAENLQPVVEMSPENHAGIEGIKAKVLLYMYQDTRVALEASLKAMELDPFFSAWKYLTGKIIRGLRRNFKEEMPREELVYFEKAVELERNPKYIVFLAQAYQEMSFLFSKRNDQELMTVIKDMLTKSADLYRECWRLKNDSAAIARRVGNGMMKMKEEFRDLNLAKEALLKAVELSPNEVTYHALGKFYYIHEMDDEKALECFEKVKHTIFGKSDMIRLKIIKDADFDPYEIIQLWAKQAENLVKQDLIYCDVGLYFLFFKHDIDMAVQYFWKVLKKDFQSFRVMEFQSYTFCISKPFNMLKLLVNEIKLLKEKNETLPPEKRHDMTFLEKFLKKVYEKHPDMVEMAPIPHLLQSKIKACENSVKFFRNKRYGPASVSVETVNWRTEKNEASGSADRGERAVKREFEQGMMGRTSRYARAGTNRGMGRTSNFNSEDLGRRDSLDDKCGPGYKEGMDNRQRMNMSRRGGMNSWFGSGSRDDMDRTKERVGQDDRDNKGITRRQNNYYNNNRYDVTITDWRSENRNQGHEKS